MGLPDFRKYSVELIVCSLIVNLLYAFYNGALGFMSHSIWLTAACIYYVILCAMRFSLVLGHRKKSKAPGIVRATGIHLCVLSIVMTFILYLSLIQDTATKYGTIPMITIATYTFTQITISIVQAVRHRKDPAPLSAVKRTIRYACVSVSLLTMQQSMLVSFQGMETGSILILNIFTGTGVCIFILLLGINLIIKGDFYGKV